MKYAEFLERSSFNQEEILGLAWGTLVDDAPAEGFPALPAPPMLMLDRVTVIQHRGNQGTIIAERDVRLDDWFFQCHFRSDPVQPGCLGVDAVWQLIGFYAGARGARGAGRALGAGEIEFFGQIRPHSRLVTYEVEIRRYTELKASGAAIAIGSASVQVDGVPVYRIRDARVGVFRGIAYADYPARSANAFGGRMEGKQ